MTPHARLVFVLALHGSFCLGCNSSDDPANAGDTSTGSTPTSGDSTQSSSATSPDSSSSATDPDGSSSNDATGVAPCIGSVICTPAFAPDWSGPIALRDHSAPDATGCDGEFSTLARTVYDELVAPPAECTCSCEPTGNATCASSSVLQHYESDSCIGDYDDWDITTSCNTNVAGASGTSFRAMNVVVEGVTCDPQFTAEVTPPAFDREYVLCSSGTADSCEGGGLCVPELEQAEDELCIWREGDFPCPEEWAAVHHRFYRELIDERRCTDCTCDEFYGTCTGYTIQLFGTNECNEAPVGGVTPGSCSELANLGATAARRGGVGVPQVDCSGEVQGGEPVGSAGPTSPVTLCCLAP